MATTSTHTVRVHGLDGKVRWEKREGSGQQSYRKGPDGEYRWYDRKAAPELVERQKRSNRTEDFEHVCLSFDDPDIPHRVQFGPNKGRGAFRTKSEVREFQARKNADGMNFKFNAD